MRAVALIFAALALVLAGCGGEKTTSPTATEQQGTIDTGTDTGGGGGGATGDAAAGKSVYASAGCGSCHTLSDAGSSGSIGPNLDDSKPDADLVVERVTNGQGAMPSFKDKLSEQEIADVAAYVSESAGS